MRELFRNHHFSIREITGKFPRRHRFTADDKFKLAAFFFLNFRLTVDFDFIGEQVFEFFDGFFRNQTLHSIPFSRGGRHHSEITEPTIFKFDSCDGDSEYRQTQFGGNFHDL